MNAEKKIIEKDLKDFLSKYGESLCYLKQRWQDEKCYEDFKSYKKLISKMFNEFKFKTEKVHKDFHIVLIHKIGTWCTDIKVKENGFSYGFSKIITKQ